MAKKRHKKRNLNLDLHVFRPDPTRAFAGHHACADGFLGCTGFEEHGALAGFDFSDDDKVAFAAKQDIFALLDMDVMF